MIDLSFINDANWIKQREALWKPHGRGLAQDFSKQKVAEIKHYFMTGTFLDGARIEDGACIDWFPLHTIAGWSYAAQHMVERSDWFELAFYASVQDTQRFLHDSESELQYWDFFHPTTYQSRVTSRVPIGHRQELVEIDVNPHRLATLIFTGIWSFLGYEYFDQNYAPKHYYRMDYCLSLLPLMSFDEKLNVGYADWAFKFYDLFTVLIDALKDSRLLLDRGELNPMRDEIAATLRDYLDNTPNLPAKMQQMWHGDVNE